MRFLSICLLGLVCFSGCDGFKDRNHPSIVAKNKQILSSQGEEVGALPDGRVVVRYELIYYDNGSNTMDSKHYIYVVPESGSVTKNSQTGGKHSFNSVQAEISQ